MYLKTGFVFFAFLAFTTLLSAKEIRIIETDVTEIEVRVFAARGDTLLLGFPCDEGKSIAEEKTAKSLSEDGIEVWMPDMLSAFMLPKVRSSLAEIADDVLLALIDEAARTGKKVYLIASGPDTELVLRAASIYEASRNNNVLGGMIIMFPRLFKTAPEPGKEPEYVDAVGKTRLPIMLLEGERTPNRWGINSLSQALQAGGSQVSAKVIPMVRGYFFKRQDSNRSETVVTSQLAGLIKVSLFYLEEKTHND
ncbi:MAG: hypothetical protein GY763_00270 [Gammaproteobacteria bacterium]|nr:hypothetical protein [Gammaproteobacteria bacterium]